MQPASSGAFRVARRPRCPWPETPEEIMRIVSQSELLRATKFELQVCSAKSRRACRTGGRLARIANCPLQSAQYPPRHRKAGAQAALTDRAGGARRPAYAAFFLRCVRVMALGSWPSRALSCSASTGAPHFSDRCRNKHRRRSRRDLPDALIRRAHPASASLEYLGLL